MNEAGALALIAEGLERTQRPYIALSGGKDSQVVAHLVHRVDPSIPMVYSDDELLFPEHVAFIRRLRDEVGAQLRIVSGASVHSGWFTPWQGAVSTYWRQPEPEMEWLPLRDGRRLRLSVVARRLGYDGAFLGLRRSESMRRHSLLSGTGGLAWIGGYWRINPLIDWTTEDVWGYIRQHALTPCSVYARFTALRAPQRLMRLGPLPLADGELLMRGWPALYAALVRRYGRRWSVPAPDPTGRRRPKGISSLDWLDIQEAIYA